MPPTFAEFDDLIEDFYWPAVRRDPEESSRITKSQAILAAQFWSTRGLWLGVSVLYNLAGNIERQFGTAPAIAEKGKPTPADHLLSAASCFALAGNWPEAEKTLQHLDRTVEFTPDEVAFWKASYDRYQESELARGMLVYAVQKLDWPLVLDAVNRCVGSVPPDLLLWPLARVAKTNGHHEAAGRCLRMLVLAEPLRPEYHIFAADHDRPTAKLTHVRFIGDTFDEDPYALVFAGYQLMKNNNAHDGIKYIERGWPLAMSATRRSPLLRSQFLYCAMATASVYRETNAIARAIHILHECHTRVTSHISFTYLAVLLIVTQKLDEAELALKSAASFEERSAWPDTLLGTIKAEQSHFHEANIWFNRAVKQASIESAVYGPLWNNFGVVLAAMGKFDEAISAFSHASGPFAADEVIETSLSNSHLVASRGGGTLILISALQLSAVGEHEIVAAAAPLLVA